jgi:lipopolysaccharide/colanic/teichoic acid biosynthesis glycosyltransferase
MTRDAAGAPVTSIGAGDDVVTDPHPTPSDEPPMASEEPAQASGGRRYAYMRSDGTLDIVLGSLVAGVAGYAYQFVGGRALGEEGFAPIGVLLTAHFLAFVIVLMPIEQFVIRRLTVGARGWVVPMRAIALTVAAAAAGVFIVAVSGDDYFTSRREFIMFMVLSVGVYFLFAVGRGYLAGFRRFRAYGYVSAAASLVRLAIAIGVAVIVPTVSGFAWAHVLGPLVIVFWRPWKPPTRHAARITDEQAASSSDRGLLAGLVLSAAASQALLLAGPLVASRLGATAAEFSVTYATLLLARAPLTLGYNLIARILPPFTEMAVRGERRELRAWARGIAIASVPLAGFGALLGVLVGPVLVSVAFGQGFAPTPMVAAIAGAGVVFAAAGLFIGQILVARGLSLRLFLAWAFAVSVAIIMVGLPIAEDPVYHVVIAFLVGEVAAMVGLLIAAVLHDSDETATSHGYVVVKRSIDIAGAMVALVILTPVLIVSAVAVRLDSPGPAFFRQVRVGREGKDFWMVKLRTMVIDHDEEVFHEHLLRLRANGEEEDADYTIRIDEDPRITRVGARLRRWSIDELPNFWNVLKGSMSLVGPRPLVPAEAELIGLDNPRFTVKPGVTRSESRSGPPGTSATSRSARPASIWRSWSVPWARSSRVPAIPTRSSGTAPRSRPE